MGRSLGQGREKAGYCSMLSSHSWPLHDFLQINHRIFQDIVSWASSYTKTRRKGFGRLRSGQGREWVMVAKSRPVVAQFPLRPALPLASTLVSTFLGWDQPYRKASWSSSSTQFYWQGHLALGQGAISHFRVCPLLLQSLKAVSPMGSAHPSAVSHVNLEDHGTTIMG